MDDNTTKIIKEKFDALPKSIQEVILSSQYEETLIQIGTQYNLNVEQMGILERETTLVMMGLTPTKNFETELIRELRVDTLKGSQIVKSINEKIFLKIRELLKLMNTPRGEEPVIEDIEEVLEAPKTDSQILNKAGIEIIPAPTPTLPVPIKVPIAPVKPKVGTEIKEKEVNPLLAQKLSSSFQMGVVKTEHTLDNITKTNAPIPVTAKPKIPNTDPYRELPE